MNTSIFLNGSSLTRAQLVAIAKTGHGIELDQAQLVKVQRTADFHARLRVFKFVKCVNFCVQCSICRVNFRGSACRFDRRNRRLCLRRDRAHS